MILYYGSTCKNRPIFITTCDVLYYTDLCNFFQTDTDLSKEKSSFLNQLIIPKKLAVSTQIFLLPLRTLANFRLLPVNKMAATDIQPGILDMESHVLAMDERWLEKILDTKKEIPEKKLQIQDNVDRRCGQKRQRKEKKIFDPSDTDEGSKTKRRRSSEKQRQKDIFLLHQSPYLIQSCFVNIERMKFNEEPAPIKVEVKLEEMVEVNQKVEVKLDDYKKYFQRVKVKMENSRPSNEKRALFALTEHQKQILSDVASPKPDVPKPIDNCVEVFRCPKCSNKFESLNRLLLHVDSAHENFTIKVYVDSFFVKNTTFSFQVRCPQCHIVLYGSGYERHCLVYHKEVLLAPKYLLNPLAEAQVSYARLVVIYYVLVDN